MAVAAVPSFHGSAVDDHHQKRYRVENRKTRSGSGRSTGRGGAYLLYIGGKRHSSKECTRMVR